MVGLVEGRKLQVDSSLIDADASRTSMVPPPERVAALREAFCADEAKLKLEEEERRTVPQHPTNFSTPDLDAPLVTRDPRSAYAASRPKYKATEISAASLLPWKQRPAIFAMATACRHWWNNITSRPEPQPKRLWATSITAPGEIFSTCSLLE